MSLATQYNLSPAINAGFSIPKIREGAPAPKTIIQDYVLSNSPSRFGPICDTMEMFGWVSTRSGQLPGAIPMAETSADSELDPEIAAMSEEEIAVTVRSLFGAWADRDDFTEETLEEMRHSWDDRLDQLYGNDPEETHSI